MGCEGEMESKCYVEEQNCDGDFGLCFLSRRIFDEMYRTLYRLAVLPIEDGLWRRDRLADR